MGTTAQFFLRPRVDAGTLMTIVLLLVPACLMLRSFRRMFMLSSLTQHLPARRLLIQSSFVLGSYSALYGILSAKTVVDAVRYRPNKGGRL